MVRWCLLSPIIITGDAEAVCGGCVGDDDVPTKDCSSGAMSIDQQEANDYVDVVEGAIFHLLSLLYPHDELILQARYRTAA